MRLRRLLTVLGTSAAAAGFAPPAAHAGIWTPVESGTDKTITAIEYQSDTRFWFTTADGAIHKRLADGTFERKLAPIGVPFNDIEFQPGGNVGLAVGDGGKVYRSPDGGDSWAPVTGIPVSNVGDGSGDKCTFTVPLGDVHFVRFAGAGRVWIGAGERQIATSQPADATTVGSGGTWRDANRKVPPVAGDNCYLDTPAPIGDMAFSGSNPDVAYFGSSSGDTVHFTTNNLTSEAAEKPAEVANGFTANGTMAIDPANPGRLWAVCGGCPYGNSGAQYTEDGYDTSEWMRPAPGTEWGFDDGPWDVDFAGGTVLIAGDAGLLKTSIDGRTFFQQPADGALATQDWRAVGVADGAKAAVGGTGGELVVSTAANTVPDTTRPTGTIGGPDTAAAGAPVTFTAQVADEPGGSGVDAGSLAWSSPGQPNAGGPSVTYTFPAEGTYTVRLTFADNAGNAAEATKTVTVTAAAAALPQPTFPGGSPVLGAAKKRGKFVVLRVKGRIGRPEGVSAAAGCNGRVNISVYRGKKRLTTRRAKVRSTCRYRKRVRVKRSRVGKAKKLKLKVAFKGNAVLAPLSSTYRVKVK